MNSTLVLVLGLIGGSFINAMVWRLYNKKNFVFDRSQCIHCGHKLGFFDLIPVVSFFMLGGWCRYCRKKISWQYPLVELASGFGLYFLALNFSGLELFWLGGMFLLSVFIFVYDLKNLIILNGSIFLGVLWICSGFIYFGFKDVQNNIFTALGIFSFFFLIYFLSKGRWIGGGDSKLGLFLGLWLGWPSGLVGLFFAYIIGSVVGMFLLILGLVNLKSKVPFGPFLITGAWGAFLWGQEIIEWYTKILAN